MCELTGPQRAPSPELAVQQAHGLGKLLPRSLPSLIKTDVETAEQPEKSARSRTCLHARWVLAWRELVNVTKILDLKIRSINRPLLGWTRSGKRPAFQKGGRYRITLGKPLHTQQHWVHQPTETPSKGDLSLPGPRPTSADRGCPSHLPRARNWSHRPSAWKPSTTSTSGSTNDGHWPRLTCPVSVNRVLLAPGQSPPICTTAYGRLGDTRAEPSTASAKPQRSLPGSFETQMVTLPCPPSCPDARGDGLSLRAVLREFGGTKRVRRERRWGPQSAAATGGHCLGETEPRRSRKAAPGRARSPGILCGFLVWLLFHRRQRNCVLMSLRVHGPRDLRG